MAKIFNKSIRSSSDFKKYYEKPSTIKEYRKRLGYDPKAIWYDRLNAVEKFTKFHVEEFRKDLEIIVEKDDDWRVRKVVSDLINISKRDCLEIC